MVVEFQLVRAEFFVDECRSVVAMRKVTDYYRSRFALLLILTDFHDNWRLPRTRVFFNSDFVFFMIVSWDL